MSLAFTPPTFAKMDEILSDLVYTSFQDEETLWDAWAEAALAGSDAEDTAAAAKFSGRALTFGFSMKFVPGWITDPAWVKKWSGACLYDHSSSMGGFCMMETNDTDTTTASGGPLAIYGSATAPWTTVAGQTGNPAVLTYRLSKTQFAGFDTAWEDGVTANTEIEDAVGQDGRCYKTYLDASATFMDVTDATLIEYLDYPNCAAATDDADVWQCKLYMPAKDKQVDGYPRFEYPGVVGVRQFSSYIPNVEIVSLIKSTTLLSSEGDNAVTGVTAFASIAVAAIAALAF